MGSFLVVTGGGDISESSRRCSSRERKRGARTGSGKAEESRLPTGEHWRMAAPPTPKARFHMAPEKTAVGFRVQGANAPATDERFQTLMMFLQIIQSLLRSVRGKHFQIPNKS